MFVLEHLTSFAEPNVMVAKRLLYIHPGLVPPPHDPSLDRYSFLSEVLSGCVLMPVWYTMLSELAAESGVVGLSKIVGRFEYRFHLSGFEARLFDKVRRFIFYCREGRAQFRAHPYDVIVTYGHTLTALAGLVLSLITGAKLIVELNSEPGRAQRYSRASGGSAIVSIACLHFIALFAHRFRLLYPTQLDRFRLLRRVPVSVFHDFVPTSAIVPGTSRTYTLLLVGYPWYLKGADTLIQAFWLLADDYPDLRLKILGHMPDRGPLEELIHGSPRIVLAAPVSQREAYQEIAAAHIYVHPARTEGMGRVLIEAMVSKTPIVASTVGGIPHYITHGITGLLCPPDDPKALAAAIKCLLSDDTLWNKIRERAYVVAKEQFDEASYVRQLASMVDETVPH